MKRAHTIIYVTGLGDRNVTLQLKALHLWRIYGVKARLFQMKWANDEAFEQKLDKLLDLIDELDSKQHTVSLVGVSAGASATMAAFAVRKHAISGVVCICGKLAHPETVSPKYYQANSAFRGAMNGLEASLAKLGQPERQRILSIRPLYDQTVSVKDTHIPGAHAMIIPTLYHVPSIVLAVTVFSPMIVFFLKKQAKIER